MNYEEENKEIAKAVMNFCEEDSTSLIDFTVGLMRLFNQAMNTIAVHGKVMESFNDRLSPIEQTAMEEVCIIFEEIKDNVYGKDKHEKN